MKVLLDEMMPIKFRHDLPGHDAFTVEFMGWKRKNNGELLQLMLGEGFQAMITDDKPMEGQLNLVAMRVPVLVVHVGHLTREALQPIVPQILDLLSRPPAAGFHHVYKFRSA